MLSSERRSTYDAGYCVSRLYERLIYILVYTLEYIKKVVCRVEKHNA